MANIRDVADSAGVSVATVSRTLQQPERVSPKTRNKVMAAVQAVGYKPNLMAVKFRSGKTHNLVVLVPTVANVFFARVISGMQEAAAELGYSILLANTLGNSEIESHYAKMVSTSQADGLIQLRAHNPFDATMINDNGLLPMVNACEVIDDGQYPVVSLDNRAAAKAMTEHLISLGHTRIAMIKGPNSSPLTQGRLVGYKDALAQANIAFDESLLFPGDFSWPGTSLVGRPGSHLECGHHCPAPRDQLHSTRQRISDFLAMPGHAAASALPVRPLERRASHHHCGLQQDAALHRCAGD